MSGENSSWRNQHIKPSAQQTHIMNQTNNIIYGPNEVLQSTETLGAFLLNCLKRRRKNDVLYIDAVTGKSTICQDLLENTIKTVYLMKKLTIEKGDVIAVISENDIGYHVPILAAFCIGAAANLLNPTYSTGELRHALLISKPKVVFCCATIHKKIQMLEQELSFINTVLLVGPDDESTLDVPAVHLDTLLGEVKDLDYEEFVPESFDAAVQNALILLSSGTTGLPKGVPLTHQNFRHALEHVCHQRYIGLSAGDIVALVLPFFHVFGLMLSFSAILGTKSIVLHKLQAGIFLRTIEQHKINKLHLVPHLLHIFSDESNLQDYDLSSIEGILVGAAPVSNTVVMELSLRLPQVNFREVYGSTEMAGIVTTLTTFPKRRNCVGRLIPNVEVKVLDSATGANLGFKEIGELCFKGPMIMSNYVGMLNDKNFIDEDGYYLSGDLGYYDEDGFLYVVDRIKDLIKYKAFQVSPVEIEQVLLQHPGIADCAVVGIPDERVGQMALAFVVCKANVSVAAREVVEFVEERISKHKCLHGGVCFIDKIPKNASGKILRKKLVELFQTDDTLARHVVAGTY